MTLVRVIKNWDWPDLMRQTPGENGVWDGIQFTTKPIKECDYAIILNQAIEYTSFYCPSEHVWAIMQEPPNEFRASLHRGHTCYSRIYTSDDHLHGVQYINSYPALPWHVNKNYDFLIRCGVPNKDRNLSWITSNLSISRGHRGRLSFLERVRSELKFDLYGRGFSPIEDKWSGLAPYRYSIVVENFRNKYYWSEKLADCFLAWTLPIYCGASRIPEFFPPGAVFPIDIDDPLVVKKIKEVISGDLWQRSADAIGQAREFVLNKYQFFPFVTQQITEHEQIDCTGKHTPEKIILPYEPRHPISLKEKALYMARLSIPKHVNVMRESIRRLFK